MPEWKIVQGDMDLLIHITTKMLEMTHSNNYTKNDRNATRIKKEKIH
jgi:hypothetical protein